MTENNEIQAERGQAPTVTGTITTFFNTDPQVWENANKAYRANLSRYVNRAVGYDPYNSLHVEAPKIEVQLDAKPELATAAEIPVEFETERR